MAKTIKKTVEINFPAGTEVYVMRNNQPVKDMIRVAEWKSMLQHNGGKPVAIERLVYSTLGEKNRALTENQIGSTPEELAAKTFRSAGTNSVDDSN